MSDSKRETDAVKNQPDSVGPSAADRCAECGEIVGPEWVTYSRDPEDLTALRWHFGGRVMGEVRRRSSRGP